MNLTIAKLILKHLIITKLFPGYKKMIKVPSGPTPAHGDLPCKSGWFKFLLDEDIASKLKRVPHQK